MQVVDLIQTKRDNGELTQEEIDSFLQAFVKGEVPDSQTSALLMAIYFNGLTDRELLNWTESESRLSRQVNLSDLPGPKIGLQSTGGVGNKTRLIVGPLVAAAGVTVPMIVGRRLAYTGGSLDKIESVPGFKTQMTAQEFKALLQTAGCGLIGTSDELAPADKKLRPLCNTTATAENVPLIVASALSKEIAEGTDGFVMDVKTGSGALTPKITDARRLAQMAVSVGKRLDKKVVALITDMDQPLGNAVGHALEIMEAIETMRGSGPEDLVELCLELSSRMVCLAYPDRTMESAKDQLFKLLNDGTALQKFRRMVEAQG
jgi:pyrimidine-nucleoside phosphorylase